MKLLLWLILRLLILILALIQSHHVDVLRRLILLLFRETIMMIS